VIRLSNVTSKVDENQDENNQKNWMFSLKLDFFKINQILIFTIFFALMCRGEASKFYKF